MLRRVHLHGPLGWGIDEPLKISGNTVAEVVEGLSRQVPTLQPTAQLGRVRVVVQGFDTEDDLHRPLGDLEELHIAPQMMGDKDNGLAQILIGTVLIGVSFIPGVGPKLASMLLQAGTLQVLGGIASMLAPSPENDQENQDSSRYLGAPRNTTKIGTRIPILYGTFRHGGHYLSFDINALEFRQGGHHTSLDTKVVETPYVFEPDR